MSQEKAEDKIRRWLADGFREDEQPDGSIRKIKITPAHERILIAVSNWPQKKVPTPEEQKAKYAENDAKLEDQTQVHNSVEALLWLQPPHRGVKSCSGGPGYGDPQYVANAKALKVVRRLYELGAVEVTAIEVSGYLENDEYQDTDKLIIELPQDKTQRKQLFKWVHAHARKRGYAPALDVEQRFLLVWWD